LIGALGGRKVSGMSVCHVWGYDDKEYKKSDSFTHDPLFYSCVGNMILLPTALKGFTDEMKEVKAVLRYCAFHLYSWPLGLRERLRQSGLWRADDPPIHYPDDWPRSGRAALPSNMAPLSKAVCKMIDKRRNELKAMIETADHRQFPREQVLSVLDAWKINL
jgi:hypothetical protein